MAAIREFSGVSTMLAGLYAQANEPERMLDILEQLNKLRPLSPAIDLAADVNFPRQLTMRVVRSPIAHGRLLSIDISEAFATPAKPPNPITTMTRVRASRLMLLIGLSFRSWLCPKRVWVSIAKAWPSIVR